MNFDIIALWTGRLLLIAIAWGIIGGIIYSIFNYLFRYSPGFRFAVFAWITQDKKDELITTIHLPDGRVYKFQEVKREAVELGERIEGAPRP